MIRLIGISLSLAWLLMVISTKAQTPAVLDTNGHPLRSGVKYYVLPAATDTAGGLTLVNRTGSCPFYVGQEPLSNVVSQGLPVIFTSLIAGEPVIREGSAISVAFSAVTTCVQSTTWSSRVEVSRIFVSTGGQQSNFRIDSNGGKYSLSWCPSCDSPNCPRRSCGAVDIFIENGKRLLVLYGRAFRFRFRRVSA